MKRLWEHAGSSLGNQCRNRMMIEAVRVATVFAGIQATPSADTSIYEASVGDHFRFLPSNILHADPDSDRSIASLSAVAHPN